MDLIRSSTTAAENAFTRVQAVDSEVTTFTPRTNVRSVDDEESPGTLETALSFYQQETLIGSTFAYSGELVHGAPDPMFNVYRHYTENKEGLEDMDTFVRQGLFDNVDNLEHFNQRTKRFRKEQTNRDNMMNGDGTGIMLGMGMSFFDVLTLVPVLGQAKKGKTLASAANYALKTGALVAGQEIALHQQQDFRTMDESLINVLASAALMSAVGGYKGMKSNVPTFKNAPEVASTNSAPVFQAADPNFVGPLPLKANDPEFIGGGGDDFVGPMNDSAGAMRVADTTTSVMDGNRGVVANALNKAVGWIDRTTPIGRSFNWTLAEARSVTQKLMDTGGRVSKGAAEGKAEISAESVKNALKTEYDTLVLQSENIVTNLNMAMTGKGRIAQQLSSDMTRPINWAQSVTGQAETFNMGLLKPSEFNEIVVKNLHGYTSADDLAKIETRWGPDNAKLIKSAADDMTKKINDANRHLEDMMVENGLITDKMRMGDDYKMAQLWNSKNIKEDAFKAKDFFIKIFQDSPTEEFIEDYGISLDDFAKFGLEDVQIKGDFGGVVDRVITKAEGQNYKGEILRDWAGNNYEVKLAEIDEAARVAHMEELVARKDMVAAASIIRQGTTRIKNLSIKVAKDLVRTTYERIELDKATRVRAKEELVASQAELRAKLEKEYAQQVAFVDKGTIKTQQAINAAAATVRKLDKAAKKGPLEGDPKAYKVAQEAVVKAEIDHALAIDDMWRNITVDKQVIGKYLQIANKARATIKQAAIKIEKKQAKVMDLEVAVSATQAAIKSARGLNKDARAAYKDMKSDWRRAAKWKQKATRIQRKSGSIKNMSETVDDLVSNLQQSNKSPQGVLTEAMFQGGRSKTRSIRMTPEQTKEAHELGILKNDLHQVLDKQWEEVSARLSIKKVFGKDASLDLSDQKKIIEDKYDRDIEALRSKNKKHSHLATEKEQVLKDIDGLLDRLYGRAGMPDDPDAAMFWITGKAREYNFTRFGPEFIVTSFTDAANMVLTNGFGVYAGKYFRASSNILKNSPDDVIHKIAVASERLLHQARHLKLTGTDNFNQGIGIGATGSAKQVVTANIDRLTAGLNEKVNVMSGLAAWNMKQKAMTMIFQQDKLVDLVTNPRLLDDLTRAKLATIGIGPDQLAQFKKMSKEFGISDDRGVKSFNAEKWQTRNEVEYVAARKEYDQGKRLLSEGKIEDKDLDFLRDAMESEYKLYAEGREAYTSFVGSMRQAADRGIMTPGIGDTPLLMDGAIAKMMMQFQTYGFVIMNKMIAPAAQRMHHYKDADAVASMAMALALGGLVVITKDMIRNGEIQERSNGQWVRDVLDRSGALAWLSPYAAAIEKTTGLGAGGSRYQANNTIGQIAGPSFGLATDLGTGINAMLDPARTDGAAKLRRLAPYQALFKIADLTSDD